MKPSQFSNLFRFPIAADAGILWKFLRRFFNAHLVRRRPLFKERAATPGHHRTRHNAIHLNAILNPLFRERLRKSRNRSIGRSNSSEGRLRIKRRAPRHENHGALACFSASHARIVKRRAPCNFNSMPAFHCSSVISKRSICGTAPAIFSSASIRPKSLKRSVDDSRGRLSLAQVERKRKRLSPRRFDGSGNFLKLLGITRRQHNSGEVARQTNSGGTSNPLAGSSYNCNRIVHDFLSMIARHCGCLPARLTKHFGQAWD